MLKMMILLEIMTIMIEITKTKMVLIVTTFHHNFSYFSFFKLVNIEYLYIIPQDKLEIIMIVFR